MRNKRKRPTDGGGNWMDTYGDMVTLLLTFFIMLFAMSNLNEQKWGAEMGGIRAEHISPVHPGSAGTGVH